MSDKQWVFDNPQEAADLIEQQAAEINALKAHIERLVTACELALNSHGRMLMSDPPQEAWKYNQVEAKLVEAIAATPRASLAERDAEVARKAFVDGFMESCEGFNGELYGDGWGGVIELFDKTANEYAKRVKRVKRGE